MLGCDPRCWDALVLALQKIQRFSAVQLPKARGFKGILGP